MRPADAVRPVGADPEPHHVGDDQQRRVLQRQRVLTELVEGGVEVRALPLVLPGGDPSCRQPASGSPDLAVVRRVHFKPRTGSPAVSCATRASRRAMTSGVFSVGRRPPPARRTRSTSTSCATSCRRPVATVDGSMPSRVAMRRSPPHPHLSDARRTDAAAARRAGWRTTRIAGVRACQLGLDGGDHDGPHPRGPFSCTAPISYRTTHPFLIGQ